MGVETMGVGAPAEVQSIADAPKEVRRPRRARGGITYTYPALMMNELLGTKFKVVTGYTGGNEVNIAMEHGVRPQ